MMNLMTRRASFRFRYTCLILATGFSVALNSPAHAAVTQRSAIDQISQEFTLRVSNPTDGVSLPSIVYVKGAELSTTSIVGSSTPAPKGKIYLTFDASAGPEQLSFGQSNWGHFFSTMTPLASSAVTFRGGTGRLYAAKESDPISQANSPNSTSDDGMLDATYWFLVPKNTRSGSISIGPATTQGMEYRGFVGQASTPLRVDGPLTFRVSFPRELTAIVRRAPKSGESKPTPTPTEFLSSLNEVLTIVSLLFFGMILWKIRRRIRGRIRNAPVYDSPAPFHQPEQTPARDATPTTPMSERHVDVPASGLRVNMLGSLQIVPSTGGVSDPIRSILAYLAVHDDRPQSADEIQTALWPESMKVPSVSQKTFLNYVSRARQSVGVQYLPDANGRPGYELVNTTSDWREFRTLAATANSSPKEQATEIRRNALQLVRGVPFEGETSTFFEWAVSQKYVTNMIETVTSVAHQLQADLVLTGDLDGATWAINQAMLLAPTEMPLWRDLVDICEARSDGSLMERFWLDAERALWPAAIKELRARLVG